MSFLSLPLPLPLPSSLPLGIDSFSSSSPSPSPPSPFLIPKRNRLDLDLPPRERWVNLIQSNLSVFPSLRIYLDKMIRSGEFGGPFIGPIFIYLFQHLLASFSSSLISLEYEEEMKGIADLVACYGFSYADILSLNLGYDLLARCTSIIVPPYHIRLMDWECDAFINAAVDIDLVKNGKVIAEFTTWPGLIGILTGIRYSNIEKKTGYTFAVNYRQISHSFLMNLITFFFQRAQPICFLSRDIFSHSSTFSEAVLCLLSTHLMAPMYISCMGSGIGEGIIIARDRAPIRNEIKALSSPSPSPTSIDLFSNLLNEPNIQFLGHSKEMFLVQTNCDVTYTSSSHTSAQLFEWSQGDELLLSSIQRRDMAKEQIKEWISHQLDRSKLSTTCMENPLNSLFASVAYAPIINRFTNYITIMSFSDPAMTYSTRSILDPVGYNSLLNGKVLTGSLIEKKIKEEKGEAEAGCLIEESMNRLAEKQFFSISFALFGGTFALFSCLAMANSLLLPVIKYKIKFWK